MKMPIIKLKAIIASTLAVFATSACITAPTEPKKQTGELVTDPSGCTYWKDSADPKQTSKTCLSRDTSSTPTP
jgi:hypothetical protein